MKRLASLMTALTLSGCAFNLTLMPRDSGKTYVGEMLGNGMGSGTITLRMDENICSGPAARVASNQSFGFANTYGHNNRGTTANAFSTMSMTGDSAVKAILSCTDGSGLRCDLTGRDSTGGGICVDDKGKVYDALAIRK